VTNDDDNTDSTVSINDRDGSASDLELLIVVEGQSTTFPLPRSGDLKIGRFVRSDIRIDHASISRFHAVLRVGPALSIEDLGSANGTRVREIALKPGRPTPVEVGEAIKLGKVTMVVQRRGGR